MAVVIPVPEHSSGFSQRLTGVEFINRTQHISALVGIDPSHLKCLSTAGLNGDVVERLSSLKSSVTQMINLGSSTENELNPAPLKLPTLPTELNVEARQILNGMLNFGSSSIQRLYAAFSTVGAMKSIQCAGAEPDGMLIDVDPIHSKRNSLAGSGLERVVGVSKRNRLSVGHESELVQSKRNKLAVARTGESNGMSGRNHLGVGIPEIDFVSSKRDRLSVGCREGDNVTSKRNRLRVDPGFGTQRVAFMKGNPQSEGIVSKRVIKNKLDQGRLWIRSINDRVASKVIGISNVVDQLRHVIDSDKDVRLTCSKDHSVFFGKIQAPVIDVFDSYLVLDGSKCGSLPVPAPLTSEQFSSGKPVRRGVGSTLGNFVNIDPLSSSELKRELDELVAGCTEAEMEELLNISAQFDDLVGSFKKINFMVNRIDHRLDVIISIVYRWLGTVGIGRDYPVSKDKLEIGLAGMDLYSEITADEALYNRLFGKVHGVASIEDLKSVQGEIRLLCGDIDKLVGLCDHIVNVDVCKLIETNKYYNYFLGINSDCFQGLDDLCNGLNQFDGLLYDVLSHVKHIMDAVRPISEMADNFNVGFVEELKHTLRDAYARLPVKSV